MKGLNEKQQKLYDVLKAVDSKTFLGLCIREWLKKDDKQAFDSTVKNLKDHAQDCPEKMKKYLGNEAFEALMEC